MAKKKTKKKELEKIKINKKGLEELEKKNSDNQISLKGVFLAVVFVLTLLYGYFIISVFKNDMIYFNAKTIINVLVLLIPVITYFIGLLRKKTVLLIITIILEIIFAFIVWNRIVVPSVDDPYVEVNTYHDEE